jgi:ABC-2 type transport system permease protein
MVGRTLRAEWIKLRSLRGSWIVVLAAIALMIAFTVLIATSVDTAGGSPNCTPGQAGCGDEDVVLMSLGGAYFAQVAFVAFGVMAITAELATGVIRSTFLTDPVRGRVFWTKAAVLASAALVAGAFASIVSFLLGQTILHGNGFVPANGYPLASITQPAVVRAVAGTAVYFVLVALLSLGVATIVRRGAGAVAAVLGLLYLPMIVSLLVPDPLRERLQVASPMMAGLSVQTTVPGTQNVPMGPLAGLAVAAAWAAGALIVGAFLIRGRDA